MSISHRDLKILWGRAAGRCSEPTCNEDLTYFVENGNYTIGEMAHIIGKKPSASRGIPEGGSNEYPNLILLCPTHHRHIDSAPERTFSIELLLEWKLRHEERIRLAGKDITFEDFEALKIEIYRLLESNRVMLKTHGPHSKLANEDPGSNAFLLWELRRLDQIVPNNQKILNLLDTNKKIIPKKFISHIEAFRIHVSAYRKHVEHRLDSYPLFPEEFGRIFSL